MPRTYWLLLVGLASLGCGGAQTQAASTRPGAPPEAGARETSPPPTAEELFSSLEERLLGALSVRLHATITAEGASEASLSGVALVVRDGRASLAFEGSFEGQPANPWLTSDGGIQSGGQLDEAFAEARAPSLPEGLLLGLTRMGLLHNLARLVGGSPPDRIDGTLRQWVSVSELTRGELELVGRTRAWPLTFRVTIDGQPAAEATLWLDAATGLPVQRRQLVRFAEGEMQVTERYERFELDVDLSGQTFDVGAPGCAAARP